MADSSMYHEFVAEAREYLAELDTAFLKLKEGYDTPDNRIEFAGILHNLLESSRFAGSVKIADLSEQMENLLSLIRESEIPLDQEKLVLLAEGKEKIALLVDDLENHSAERSDIQDILERIKKFSTHLKNSIAVGGQKTDDSADDFSNLFESFDVDETTFEEPPEILAALSEDDIQRPAKKSPGGGSVTKQAETGKLFQSGDEATTPPEKDISNPPGAAAQPPGNMIPDLESLQEEIQATEQEEELFQVFIQQLHENISLLTILRESVTEVSDKSQVLGKCSDLISKLHSSANYMGYNRLTDFYGQWIAELEMTDMELSMGNRVSFDFMDANLRLVTELFPQIEEVQAEQKTDVSTDKSSSADLFSEEEKESPEGPAPVGSPPDQEQEDENEDFSELFSTFGDFEEDDFEEEKVIAALSDEEPSEASPEETKAPAEDESPIPELEQKLSHFFDEPEEDSPSPEEETVDASAPQLEEEQNKPERKTRRHEKLITDTASLKEEIESEEYDDELFQIFIEQLQENISQLRTLADNFPDTPNKPALIKRCSDLVTALHSSANYMGYERLTEFYGQWIAELEMTDLQLSIGVPFSVDFMDSNIKTIIKIFPQIRDVQANIELPQPPPAETGPAPSSSGQSEKDEIEPIAALSDLHLEAPGDEIEDVSTGDVEYDQVTASFTESDDEVDEDFEFDDIFGDDTEPPVDTDNRRKQLFERLSGALESLSGESAEPGEQQTEEIVSLLQDEIRQKATGRERFEQYLRSISKDIAKLQDLSDAIKDAGDSQQALREYSVIIEKNISLAASMDYERLESFYSRWHKNIIFSLEALDEYEPANLDYLAENINILGEVFKGYLVIPDDILVREESPPANRLSDNAEAPSQPGKKDELRPPAEDQQLFDKLSRALDDEEEMIAPEGSVAAFEEDIDRQLFEKLSSALEEKGFDRRAAGIKSIDDVVNEILSGEGVPAGLPPSGPKNDLNDSESPAVTADFPGNDEPGSSEAEEKQGKSIRVDADKIDQLMDQVQELMISRTNLTRLFNEFDHVHEDLSNAGFKPETLRPLNDYADKLDQANEALGRIAGEITEGVLSVRKVTIGSLFRQYPDLIRRMVRQSGKKVKFTIQGEDTLVDQGIIDEISAPLAHILQNGIEHGIELPAERKKAGKDETGTLVLEAYPEANAVVIEISDDGKGIDPLEVQKKALELNIATEEQIASMDEADILRLIMEPGFSTLPDQSGPTENRICLDTVRQVVNELKGAVDISSHVGTGTIIRIKIPLVLSVIQALGIEIGSTVLTVPVTNAVETTRIRWEEISDSNGIELITHRNISLPVFRMNDILNIQGTAPETSFAYILVVQAKDQRAGLIVDGFKRPRETVVKPLAEYLRKESGFSGATVLDNGSISLVLDTATLLEIIKDRTLNDTRQAQLENALKGMETA